MHTAASRTLTVILIRIIMTETIQTLRLLQFASATLPVGSFAYSQGMESAVHHGYINNAEQTQDWIKGVLANNLTRLDLPFLKCTYESILATDFASVTELNQQLIAFRETDEIRQECTQMGKALRRLLVDLELWDERMPSTDIDWVIAFALMAVSNELTVKDCLLANAWSWCENQVAAAIKLVPLGQTEGQKILYQLSAVVVDAVNDALEHDMSKVSSLAFNLSILSSEHETQYSRLFRS